jgi:hypothetical protein
VWGCGLDPHGSGQSPVASCCEHGNERSGSVEGGTVLDQLGDRGWTLLCPPAPTRPVL